ncbi:MAG: hypothetical protein U1E61_10625 [Bradyrhizobium sp.]
MSAQDDLLRREALEYFRSREKDEIVPFGPLAIRLLFWSAAIAFWLTVAFLALA